jgi:hypothetical protein
VYCLDHAGIALYFSIDSVLLAFPFYAAGAIVRRKNMITPAGKWSTRRMLPMLCAGIACLALLALAVQRNPGVNVKTASFGTNITLFYLDGFLGIAAVIILSLAYTREWQPLTSVSNGTMLIMAFHMIPAGCILTVFGLYKTETVNAGICCLIGVVVVALFIPLYRLVRRHFPLLIGGLSIQGRERR